MNTKLRGYQTKAGTIMGMLAERTLVRDTMASGLKVLDEPASPVATNASGCVEFEGCSRNWRTLCARTIDRIAVIDAFSLRSSGRT